MELYHPLNEICRVGEDNHITCDLFRYGIKNIKMRVSTKIKDGIYALDTALVWRLRYGYNNCYARFRAAPGVRVLKCCIPIKYFIILRITIVRLF